MASHGLFDGLMDFAGQSDDSATKTYIFTPEKDTFSVPIFSGLSNRDRDLDRDPKKPGLSGLRDRDRDRDPTLVGLYWNFVVCSD